MGRTGTKNKKYQSKIVHNLCPDLPSSGFLFEIMKNQKEITIAYGNEIQLTTTGEKNKQVFLKLSPEFRKKQLKELKGAPLSVFICYALHSDEQGYTWVDDKTIKKETGYSITSEVRQKLIKKGYLYQERLYDEKNRFKDWIYRIFQPVEPNKEFIINGVKQHTPTREKTYIGKNPISGKDGGIIEEEPYNKEEEPNISDKSESDKPDKEFSFKDYLEKLKDNKRKDLHIIGLYWEYKNFKFENKDQCQSALKRDLRPAQLLKGYSDEDIIATMDWLCDNVNFKWTLETVHKFIDEDLDELETFDKKGRQKFY